jgi:hypothetical protein
LVLIFLGMGGLGNQVTTSFAFLLERLLSFQRPRPCTVERDRRGLLGAVRLPHDGHDDGPLGASSCVAPRCRWARHTEHKELGPKGGMVREAPVHTLR